MSSYSYKGDSPAKKVARASFWLTVAEAGAFSKRAPSIVLCSRWGGDISTLLTMGALPGDVWAVDKDVESVHLAGEQGVKTFCGDVFDFKIPKRKKRPLVLARVALLDFCGILSDSMMDGVARFTKANMAHGSILGLGFMCGREKNGSESADKLRKIRLEWEAIKSGKSGAMDKFVSAREFERISTLFPEHGQTEEDYLEFMRESGRLGEPVESVISRAWDDPRYVRAHVALHMLEARCSALGCAVAPLLLLGYQSAVGNSPGVPMLIVAMTVMRFPRTSKPLEIGRAHLTSGSWLFGMIECDEVFLRQKALATVKNGVPPSVVAGMLNLEVGTVRAWMAHETRGTYDNSLLPM